MRQLHFVRPTGDGIHLLVETDDGSEQFHLRDDARLHAPAGSPFAPPPAPPTPVPTPKPTVVAAPIEFGPRDIQVRVRAGESPQELADSLGVPLERVQRFAEPVMAERLRISEEARRGRAHRSGPEGGENKVLLFGEAVDARFTAHGIVAADVHWDSRRREDGEWIIVADWLGGEGRHAAEWLFHRSSRSVTPLDDTASDLLSDRPIRPVLPPEPYRPSLAAAPPLAPGVVAFPAFADAQTGPLPVLEDVFDQEAEHSREPRNTAVDHDARLEDARGDVPPSLVPAGAEDRLTFDAPPLPLGITDPGSRPGAAIGIANLRNLHSGKRTESEDDRAARARVPSWDDILLGVRRKQD